MESSPIVPAFLKPQLTLNPTRKRGRYFLALGGASLLTTGSIGALIEGEPIVGIALAVSAHLLLRHTRHLRERGALA